MSTGSREKKGRLPKIHSKRESSRQRASRRVRAENDVTSVVFNHFSFWGMAIGFQRLTLEELD